MSKKTYPVEQVRIEKLVHGGQGIGTLADGRKVFVWNALPNELVQARLIKQKRSFAEAIAEDVIESSPERIAPREENYLATSPWQIMTRVAENTYKRDIVTELFAHEHVQLRESLPPVIHDEHDWHYRNKMEYSFWGDDDGLHLALHKRGSHGKQIVQGSALALPALDEAAQALLVELRTHDVRAGDLKTVILRATQTGVVAASLFVKTQTFTQLTLPTALAGLRVYHSDPRSPASVPTALLYELGDVMLTDTLLGREFQYDVDSFFQVNVPMFEQALGHIQTHMAGASLVDMYAGVGSIGLSVATTEVQLIELDAASAAMARHNSAQRTDVQATVVEVSTEKALDHITSQTPLIVDPPRAGLHPKVVARVLDETPPQMAYLSCNPATLARDLAMLQQVYDISHTAIFNFFPQTPHIETLAVLQRR